jgi:hypothetical protein
MKRFVRAIPLSTIRGVDDFGLFRRRRRETADRPGERRGLFRRRRDRRPPPERNLEPVRTPQPREAQLERIPGPTPGTAADPDWGPLTRMSDQLRVQARRGHRAAVIELQPGMYIVAEVSEEMVQPRFGVLPLLAPLVVVAANRALQEHLRRQDAAQAEPAAVYEPPPPPALPAPRQIAGPVVPGRWASPEDVEAVIAGCRCKRGR